jgi:VIT1/CCC1 family predicted Fe2+/Mn2+ transporter/rubrerythrin
MYHALAQQDADSKRAELFKRLAKSEEAHAQRYALKLQELGVSSPDLDFQPGRRESLTTRLSGSDITIRRMEIMEERYANANIAESIDNPDVRNLFSEIEKEEKGHAQTLQIVTTGNTPASRLEALFKREKWHVRTGSWLGDAIYGINDGLGAVFGIVLAVAGYAAKTQDSRAVLVAGVAGMLASAMSMGAGAYLAAKSEREVYQAELDRERREIEEHPELEIEELQLIYQIKGFSEEEAKQFATTMASNPDQMLNTLAHEELGLSQASFPNPLTSTISALISTGIGGFIPVAPFLFMSGTPAVITSAIISTLAHFAVGASKTFVTGRSWLKSGTEMTVVGIIEAILSYGVGVFLGTKIAG